MGLKCVVQDCDESAFGLICLNDNVSGLTMFMIPACNDHGQMMKTEKFVISMNGDLQPTIEMGESLDEVDLVLTYEVLHAGEPDQI